MKDIASFSFIMNLLTKRQLSVFGGRKVIGFGLELLAGTAFYTHSTVYFLSRQSFQEVG